MKKFFFGIVMSTALCIQAKADTFNSISMQGRMEQGQTPLTDVQVAILSGGAQVTEGTPIAITPDAEGNFSTQTYISNPRAFLSGNEYTVQLSSNDFEHTIIATFSLTAFPFALAIRGDQQTGDQNVFGAYGNVGIGTENPKYQLTISSIAGTAGDLLVISTGTSEVIKMTGGGIIYATKFIGDGSGLTNLNLSGSGDNLGNHTATTTLNMAGFDITSSGNITASGNVKAAKYFIGNNQAVAVLTGSDSFGSGVNAGINNSGSYNTFIGNQSGTSNTTGGGNSFVGSWSGFSNTSGGANTFVGRYAGMQNTNGNNNTLLGHMAGYANTSGNGNLIAGNGAGNANTTGSGNTILGNTAAQTTTTGSDNIVIGNAQRTSAPDASNELNIGGTIFGNLSTHAVGISTRLPQATLDIVSGGDTQYAQIWRNSDGIVIASISATGALMADSLAGDISADQYLIGGTPVLALLPGNKSLGVGANAGKANNGDFNTFIGNETGYNNTTGAQNTFVGTWAGHLNAGGSDNTLVGRRAGENNINGSGNTIVGSAAGNSTTGARNTIVGHTAGFNISDGSDNIIIGDSQDTDSPTASNKLNIGGVIFGDLVSKTIGISTRVPAAALDVVSTGTTSNELAQVWRNSNGDVKSSLTADGTLTAVKFVGDGAGISGIPGDNLGDHTASQDLKMSGKDIVNAGAITANSQVTTYSTLTVTGNAFSVGGNSLLAANGKIGISSSVPTEALSVQGNINISGNYYKNGSALPAPTTLLSATNTWTASQAFGTVAATSFTATQATISTTSINTEIVFAAASAPTGVSGKGILYYDSATNVFMVKENNGTAKPIVDPPGNWTCTTRSATGACSTINGGYKFSGGTVSCSGNEKLLSYSVEVIIYDNSACTSTTSYFGTYPPTTGAILSGQSVTGIGFANKTNAWAKVVTYANCCQ